ncbi:hypothetical protein FOA43_002208 [Brettanomyces nanus]|uniref:Phospholipid-transporting ATPase n=1 Tax=Eeniella nana TaxID=13502 RepID=A0A875S481_EENNA|nr:uncharacterized protein FOA43_002208 [Brettanomyces nanus]QPG74872.1 hypothetical protein FOA43_002208 [Brettanomyces nanus]
MRLGHISESETGAAGADSGAASSSPKQPSKPIRTRKRGFRFRNQLLHQQKASHPPSKSSQSLLQPPSLNSSSTNNGADESSLNEFNRNTSISETASAAAHALQSMPEDQSTQDIELRQVDQTYNPGEWQIFRDNETSENNKSSVVSPRGQKNGSFKSFGSHVTNESVIELSSDSFLSRSKTKIANYSRFRVLKRFKNLLMGISEPIPSQGGRVVPISVSMDPASTDFPTITNRHGRILLIDDRVNVPYVSNTITSSKYTIFSFLPRQIFAQFSKIANCYFMIVAIMQLVPTWSTTGTTTTIIPLSIFISISIAREGWDDLRRHRLDKLENEHMTYVLRETNERNSHIKPYRDHWISGESSIVSSSQSSRSSHSSSVFSQNIRHKNSSMKEDALAEEGLNLNKTQWSNIKVGEIVKLECDEWVPADIILLTSTNDLGETFIETMALDGETNLKSRVPNSGLHHLANEAKTLRSLNAIVRSEDPNLDLYHYEGALNLTDAKTHECHKYPLGPENIIYRGSIIRNTKACLGLVIFTGEETKIRMNSIRRPRIKAPKLQRSINIIVIFMVCVVILLSSFSTMGERLLYKKNKNLNWYIYEEDVGVAATLMGFIIMLNTVIPLSLYVTMEIIKIMQMFLLQWDIDMYDPDSNTPAEARTATILEELGQVRYIFSDKTGTLTDNKMIFRKLSVGGSAWIHDIDERLQENNDNDNVEDNSSNQPALFKSPTIRVSGNPPRPSEEVMGQGSITFTGRPSMASLTVRQSRKTSSSPVMSPTTTKTGNSPEDLKSTVELIRYVQTHPKSLFARKVSLFLVSVALCHTCLPKREELDDTSSENDDNTDGAIEYQASSPDELALVQAASDMGFVFYSRKQKIVTLQLYPSGFDKEPVFEKYEVLDTVDFSSARKCMSIVIRFPDEKIYLLCKGADNIIMEKLKSHGLAGQKRSELARSITERKQIEADLVLANRSMDLRPSDLSGRKSSGIGARVSGISLSRPSNLISPRLPKLSISSLTESQNEARQVDEVISQSKRSIQMMQKQKFNEQSYIPTEKLIENEEFVIEKTLQHVEEFSSDGLRTLLYAYRTLTEDEYHHWSQEYAVAKTSVKNRGQKVEEVGGKLEEGLSLLGCTAIEDKLQDGVPDTIEKLRRAGLKMWMLTGDKRETAINIGYSCRLIKDYSKVVILSSERNSLSELSSMMTAAEIEIDEGNVAHCVVVIDGTTVNAIEEDMTLMSLFISFGVKADSVICCRASPSQKAELVDRVRKLRKGEVTLAIGDGANDIAMIQNADVGVGITGREGLQAARASDYSIARFRFLQKLLLVNGRYNYVRTSKFVLCTFYKELMFYLTQLLYQRYTLFTGSSLYEPWSLSMFNTLFTSLPVMFVGMFDKDLRPSTLIAVPELYAMGCKSERFNLSVFVQWIVLSAAQSVTLFFTMIYIYGFNATLDNTTYPLGMVLYTALVFVICTKCCIIETHNITKLPVIAWAISVFGWLMWLMLLVGLNTHRMQTIFYVNHGLFEHFGKDITFWGSILALIFVGVLIDLIYEFVHDWLRFSDTQVFQQLEQQPGICEKFELVSYNVLKQGWMWLHDSVINEEIVKDWPKARRRFYYFRSFLRKGSIYPSKATKKRRSTMVNPKELPPGSPSVVKLASSDRYEKEMLPSGKVVRKKKTKKEGDEEQDTVGSRRPRSKSVKFVRLFGSKNDTDNAEGTMQDADIDEVLQRRMKDLEQQ